MNRCTIVLILIFSLVSGLFFSVRPVHNYTLDKSRRILLDHSELSIPKHPTLIKTFNYIISSLPFSWQRYLIPLDFKYLMSKAQSQAANELNSQLHPKNNKPWNLLRYKHLQDVASAHPLQKWNETNNGLTGLHALLHDLDGDPTLNASRPLGDASTAYDAGIGYSRLSSIGRFATQQQIIGALKQQLMLTVSISKANSVPQNVVW